MSTPLVSTVIAVFNGADTIMQALDSVAAQTYRNIEIICVEDGSTDTTYETLIEWQKNHVGNHMQIIRNERNFGLAASLNRGIAAAKGEYIARIDADDEWLPEKIEKQTAFLTSHPEHGLVGSFYVNEKSNKRRQVHLPVKNSEIKHRMFQRNPFGHSCVVMRTQLLKEVGGYKSKLREDRDLWFRLLHKTRFHNIPEFLVVRNISISHFTSSKELKRNIQTVHTYIRKYRAPLYTYIWLVEPLAVYAYHTLKKHAVR